MKYKCLQTIWHSGECRHYYPGDVVSLDHLNDAGRETLVQLHIVEPVEGPAEGELGSGEPNADA